MKLATWLNRSAIAALLLPTSVSVFATPPRLPQPDWHQYVNTAPASVLSSADIDVIRAFAMTAASPVQDTGTVVTAGAAVHGTTRAQVRAELLQAEETGLIPADKIHYPPDAQTRARNRAQFQQAENWWRAHGQLNPSMQ